MTDAFERISTRQQELEAAGAEALRNVADLGDKLAGLESQLFARLDSEMQ